MTIDDTCELSVPTMRHLTEDEVSRLECVGDANDPELDWFMACTLREAIPYAQEAVDGFELMDTLTSLALIAVFVRHGDLWCGGSFETRWLESDDPLQSGVAFGWSRRRSETAAFRVPPGQMQTLMLASVMASSPSVARLDELLRLVRDHAGDADGSEQKQKQKTETKMSDNDNDNDTTWRDCLLVTVWDRKVLGEIRPRWIEAMKEWLCAGAEGGLYEGAICECPGGLRLALERRDDGWPAPEAIALALGRWRLMELSPDAAGLLGDLLLPERSVCEHGCPAFRVSVPELLRRVGAQPQAKAWATLAKCACALAELADSCYTHPIGVEPGGVADAGRNEPYLLIGVSTGPCGEVCGGQSLVWSEDEGDATGILAWLATLAVRFWEVPR